MTPAKQAQRARATFAEAAARHRSGDLGGALAGYEKALRDDPQLAEAHNNHAIVLTQLGRAETALASFARVAAIAPPSAPVHADALANRGVALGNLGRFGEALAAFDGALALAPAHGLARQYRAVAAAALAAETAPTPTPADPHFAAGLAAAAAGDFPAALAAFDAALAANGGRVDAAANRGLVLLDLGRPAEALVDLDRALASDPALAPAHAGRGRALRALGRDEAALAAFDAALAAGGDDAACHYARGEILAARRQWSDALAAYRAAAERAPALAAAHYGCGLMHWRLGAMDAALTATEVALARDAGSGAAHNLRGVALKALGRREEALAAFDAALARTPDDASAHSNRGELLRELGRIDEAAAAIAAALAADPVFPYAAGQLLHLRMHLADWTGHDRALAAVSAGVGTDTTLAFPLLALIDDPALHARAAARQIAAVCPVRAPALPPHPPGPKLRIGYFSSDFFWHATMFLLAEVLEAHDRIQVEVVLFSFGPDTGDPWRRRAEAAADRFIDVRMMADPEVAALARSLDIDIAVDLKGLTGDARPGIFAARAAPLQVNWLGYPGTMPAPFIDYLFADPHVAVPAEREHLAEAVIALPDSYQPNCRIAADPAAPPARADLGLPERGFVFCCFNQCYKITPERFAVWMRILAAVPGSVLWLWAEQETARANLRREAAARGIDPARLVFAALVPRDRHLARLPQADLFLDTGPYGAHTSGSDALRAGVPLLTVPGRSFASRVGASLLHAAGLPELVAADIKEYEARAISLARDPGALAGLRARLARRGATPLFAPDRFARNLEAAYRALDARARAGLPPADIAIPSDG